MRFVFIFFPMFFFAQQVKKMDTVFCDCGLARTVTLKNNVTIGPTIAPPGPGLKNEISPHLQRTKFAFEKEHASAWYKLIIGSDGFLVFDIVPSKAADDYDFMLFAASKIGFCDSLTKFHVKPLRACISRNKEEIKGLTGLSFKGNEELLKEGLGDAYAKPVEVKSGEVYYLVLDNVYKNGEGHTINFYFEEKVTIKGIVLNEDQKPVSAEVTITAPNGDTINKLYSDKKGNYDFVAALRKNLNYSLNFYNDSSFFFTKEISTKTHKDTLANIVTVLPTLKKGNKYIIQNINFQPGSINLLPTAMPSVKNLAKLMHKNPSLKILIVGHMNGCERGDLGEKFTNDRAITVKKYLTTNAILGERIKTAGKGCTEMLYPYIGKKVPTDWQQVLNRRVEVFITEK